MTTFLEYVARDIVRKYGYDLSRTAVVFPNKRASLFLNNHLASIAGRPLWSPAYITISDLFRKHSSLTVGDPVKLICDLHKSFTKCTGIDETLDKFYGWGQLLLADFDDIDKNMADARQVFTNLANIHELDDISYLSTEQKAALQRFFSNFSDDQDSLLKQKFISLWSHFHDIYVDFHERLHQQGIAYEGMLYREVAENQQTSFLFDRYLFVGFNMMQKAEQSLCKRLMHEGKAKFYWDFDHYYLHPGSINEAGHFIGEYLLTFPNELDSTDTSIYQQMDSDKQITFISAPTENLQARYVSHWLRRDNRIADGRSTAIVLCNEGLLQTVVHCLPPEADKVNITTGYPLQQSPVCSLIDHLIVLQSVALARYPKNPPLHYVNAILRHPYATFLSPLSTQLSRQLTDAHRNYPSINELAADQQLAHLFTPLGEPFVESLSQWLLQIVKTIAINAESSEKPLTQPNDAFIQESLFRIYTLLNRLHTLIVSGDLTIDAITYQRLVGQLTRSSSIPFHGEPAEGLQLMGVLETRNLDFKHVLILSCNEGNLPQGNGYSSFIPHTIRRAFGLTTIEHKDAISSYYFHRLIQRASNITILYNNATSKGQTGQMSRYMLQLLVESHHQIERKTLQAGQNPNTFGPQPIVRLANRRQPSFSSFFSPTAINSFLRCQLRYYYHYVAKIKEPYDDNPDDGRMFGNIFHKAAELLYCDLTRQSRTVTASQISQMLANKELIETYVDRAINKELFHQDADIATRPAILNGLQTISRQVAITYLRQLLRIDLRLAPFTIAGIEKEITHKIRIGSNTITLGGTIDRLDIINTPEQGPCMRVIDYKTGHLPKSLPADIDEVFDPTLMRNKHTDYYLQALFYSLIVSRRTDLNPDALPVRPALVFIQHAGAADYDPTLQLKNQPIEDAESLRQPFSEHITTLLTNMLNPEMPFMPTEDRERCANCPYRQLCGA